MYKCLGFLRDYVLLRDWMLYKISREREAQLEHKGYIEESHTRVPESKMGEGRELVGIKHLTLSAKGQRFLDRWSVLDFVL